MNNEDKQAVRWLQAFCRKLDRDSGVNQPLNEFESKSFAAVHLGATVAEDRVFKMIPLADCRDLRQRLPWLGGMLRVYQQERRPDGTAAKYIAAVETTEVEVGQQGGELRVVLSASNGKRSEVLLSFDVRGQEFPNWLPAEESQLRLNCHADDAA